MDSHRPMSLSTQPESESSLPAYTHIPGITPHPLGDPRGHSFGQAHPACPPPDWQSLPDCELLQHGRRLFNAGYYWEAHEAWEGVWIAAGRQGLVADYVKGLIKLAAAGVKIREGSAVGAQRHFARAEELFSLTSNRLNTSSDTLSHLLTMTRSYRQALPASPAANSGQPVPLLGEI